MTESYEWLQSMVGANMASFIALLTLLVVVGAVLVLIMSFCGWVGRRRDERLHEEIAAEGFRIYRVEKEKGQPDGISWLIHYRNDRGEPKTFRCWSRTRPTWAVVDSTIEEEALPFR